MDNQITVKGKDIHLQPALTTIKINIIAPVHIFSNLHTLA